jgi:hypothetical protein
VPSFIRMRCRQDPLSHGGETQDKHDSSAGSRVCNSDLVGRLPKFYGGAVGTSRVRAFASALILVAGCGVGSDWANAPVPPFRLGVQVGNGPPSQPQIEVLQPANPAHLVLKPGERIACVLRLTYAGSGTLPVSLRAVFRNAKGAEAGSSFLEPQEVAGQSFTIGARLKAPSRPGRYRLQIDLFPPPAVLSEERHDQAQTKGSVTTIVATDVEVTTR